MSDYIGGIEAGGTKFVCVIGNGPEDIIAEQRFNTTSPAETIHKTIEFFRSQIKTLGVNLTTVGIGSFGPLCLDPGSPEYGKITSTPKPGWRNSAIVKPIRDALQLPVVFDTDVNAAALGEGKWGAGKDIKNFLYFTIGTGIGGGAVINGRPLHGLIHPEMGHILLSRRSGDSYSGKCPFHQTCFEGLASGPAIQDRWSVPPQQLAQQHPGWELEADYIAQAMSSFICSFSPQRIILGGGVMQQSHLFSMIREKTIQYLNGYVQSPAILEHIDEYIVPAQLGNQAGVLGAIALAQTITNDQILPASSPSPFAE